MFSFSQSHRSVNMHYRRTLITAIILTYTSILFTQPRQLFLINGHVYDHESGEPLIGATIFLPHVAKGTLTDALGRYSLALSAQDSLRIQVSYVGYQKIDTSFIVEKNTSLNFRLKIQSLQEVEIKSKIGSLQHNIIQIPVERLKAIPMLFGQPDLIKSLSFLPGVTTGVEGTTGLFVRGGTPDQNLILLDGATVYNSSHLFGFQSVFDPSAIKDIRLIKGGFPARYGGRLSSIIDITMKEGNNQKKHGEFTLGLINSGLMLEGPIQKGRSSYMVSGRAAYLGLLLLPTALGWKKQDDRPFNTMLSYDFNLKANHEFKDKAKLFVSAYVGRDIYLTKFRFDSSFYQTDLGWGNQTASIRYVRPVNNKIYAQSQLSYNAYSSVEKSNRDYISTDQESSFVRQSTIQDWSFKQNFSLALSPSINFSAGAELLKQTFQPSSISLASPEFSLDSLAEQSKTYHPFSYAVFAEGDWDVLKSVKINIGLRRSSYQINSQSKNYWEPRLNITFAHHRFSYNLAYAATSQFVHLLANNSLGLFSDLWVPSTEQVSPQSARQYSGGIIYKTPSLKWEFSVEAFQKHLNNQIDYRQGVDFFEVSNFNWENTIEKNGIGRAKGVEVMIKRETERFNAWLAYTLSNNERKFTNINGGEWYPFRYDKRHNLSLNLVKRWKNNWTWGLNFVVQSGSWVTLLSGRYQGPINNASSLVRIVNQSGIRLAEVRPGRNNQRLPTYHRMDCSFTKNYQSKKNNSNSALSFSVYNLYARENPYAIYPSLNVSYNSFSGYQSFYYVRSKALFSFIPTVSYTKKW